MNAKMKMQHNNKEIGLNGIIKINNNAALMKQKLGETLSSLANKAI